MRSVNARLRRESREALARLTAWERIQIALELGDADLALLCESQGISREAARRIISDRRAVGRRRAACFESSGP